MLKEEDGIVVADRRFEQSLGIVSRGGVDHLQARRMHEVHLRIRRMESAAMYAAAGRPANDDGHGSAPAVMGFGHEIGDLVKGASNEVDELHLRDRAQSQIAHADRGAYDRGFADGRIDHAFPAETLQQARRGLEGAAVNADIFAQQQDSRIAVHFLE